VATKLSTSVEIHLKTYAQEVTEPIVPPSPTALANMLDHSSLFPFMLGMVLGTNKMGLGHIA
jgi:hypothetical protein